MQIIIKPGVDLLLRAPILYGLIKAIELASEIGATELRITSGYRRKTGKLDSYHQVRLAVDYVVEGVNIEEFKKRLKAKLSPDHDIIYHDAGTGNHIHHEFDEK